MPVKKKNGQIRVCIDFRNLNKACPKDDFLVPHMELLIDVTTGYKALSFMDGYLGYNQIQMHPYDAEMTPFPSQRDALTTQSNIKLLSADLSRPYKYL